MGPVHQSIQTTWLPELRPRQQINERLGQLIEAVPMLLDDAKSPLPYPLTKLLERFIPLLL